MSTNRHDNQLFQSPILMEMHRLRVVPFSTDGGVLVTEGGNTSPQNSSNLTDGGVLVTEGGNTSPQSRFHSQMMVAWLQREEYIVPRIVPFYRGRKTKMHRPIIGPFPTDGGVLVTEGGHRPQNSSIPSSRWWRAGYCRGRKYTAPRIVPFSTGGAADGGWCAG
jgi:hypothetical protein